jgi:hypothetical protein
MCNFCLKRFSIPRRTERYMITNAHRSSCNVSCIHVIFQRNLNFLGRFWKNTRIKCIENPSSGRRVVQCGRTDGQTDKARHNENKYCRFLQFSERAGKFYVLPTQCIYVFCVDLRTNSGYFPIQH